MTMALHSYRPRRFYGSWHNTNRSSGYRVTTSTKSGRTDRMLFDCPSYILSDMMTSSNGNIFRVAGHLCGEFTGPVNSPHNGQWRGALMFSLIWVWINGWVNNREAGVLRGYRAHYDVIVMERWVRNVQLWYDGYYHSTFIWIDCCECCYQQDDTEISFLIHCTENTTKVVFSYANWSLGEYLIFAHTQTQ